MSVLGTGVAAGVAQTAQQAQETARRRKTEDERSSVDARELRDHVESHLQAVEEDEAATASRPYIDGQVPDRESGGGSAQQGEAESQGEGPYGALDVRA